MDRRATDGLRQAQIRTTDPAEAVRRLHEEIAQPEGAALVLFFSSPALDPAQISAELRQRFGDTPLMGCTTAGEIGPAGYLGGSLCGLSLPASRFRVARCSFGGLDKLDFTRAREIVRDLQDQLAAHPTDTTDTPGGASRTPGTRFALLLVDGLSGCEEHLTRSLQAALGSIPLVGGSAGDGLDFQTTRVWADGELACGHAALALVATDLPVQVFMTQHFVPTDRRAVVTRADPAHRIVHEIDGLPAAQAYADLVGVPEAALDAAVFAAMPMAVMIGGAPHIRSIVSVLPDRSLRFHCAIDEGLVLRTSRGVDLRDKLAQTFAQLAEQLGPLQAVIGCDCVLRRLELEHSGQVEAVAALMRQHRVVGFTTYGEQYRGVHVNQTFTGLAIGTRIGPAAPATTALSHD